MLEACKRNAVKMWDLKAKTQAVSPDFSLTVNVPGVTISYVVLLKVWPFGLCAYIGIQDIIFLIYQYFPPEMILREG